MQVIKFLKNLLIFTIILFALGFLIQYFADNGLRKSDYSRQAKEWDDIVKSRINADIIILGSSKAWLQISPKDFEEAFKMSTYNLGMDGHHFRMQKWRLDVYLKHNKKPKYLIQVFAQRDLDNPPIDYEYNQFIPYLNEGYISRFGNHGYLGYLDYFVPLYKYCHQTGMLESALISFAKTPENNHNNGKYKGFFSYDEHWNDSSLVAVKKSNPHGIKAEIDPVTYADLLDMIKYCKEQKIDLIVVSPPTYIDFQKLLINQDEIIKKYEDLSKKYHFKMLNYLQDTICRDTAMFYNFNHLNTRGVKIFNKQLIGDLRSEIK